MHCSTGHFDTGHFNLGHFPGGGYQYLGGTVTVQVYWRFGGQALASTVLNYWVMDSGKQLVQAGSVATDESGYHPLLLPATYSGQSVLLVINNIDSDMGTAGKIHSQKVVVVP